MLVVSSAAVYGSPERLPITEEHPVRPISPYGHHSRLKELVAVEDRVRHGTRVCVARVFSTYGPGLRRLAFWDIAQRVLAGTPTARGTGLESRDYLHARDVAAALVAICENAPFAGEIVNVGSGVEVEVRQLAEQIYRALGIRRTCHFDGHIEPGKPYRWKADASLLRGFGYEPRIPLEVGVRETVGWILRTRGVVANLAATDDEPSSANAAP
jgi:UDP-glucose 4-epimerase